MSAVSKWLAVVIFFTACAVLCTSTAQALEVETFNGRYVVAGEVLVEYTQNLHEMGTLPLFLKQEQEAGVFAHKSLTPTGDTAQQTASRERLAHYFVAQFASGTVEERVRQFEELPYVASVQPNYIYVPLKTPNDVLYSLQWSHQVTGMERAWEITTQSPIIVGVIDTGIDYTHPDLSANIWTGTVGGMPVHGWNFYDNTPDPIDTFGHGTGVAGILGAVGNNTLGPAGVSWDIDLMALRVLGAEHLNIVDPTANMSVFTTSEAIVRAIQFAADHGARIINLSLGGLPSPLCDPAVGEPKKPIEEQFIRNLTLTNRILFVAAAGNNRGNANCTSPAIYDEVLVVTATDRADKAASYSNHTPASWKETKVIAAPGGDADPASGDTCTEASCPITTYINGTYVAMSGTSAATPYVSGVAALVLSLRDMDPLTLKQHLIDTADDVVDPQSLGGRSAITYGKRINAERALASLITPPATPSATPVVTLTDTPTATPPASLSPTPVENCLPPGNINCDDTVNIFDLSALLRVFGTDDPSANIDGVGDVSVFDLNILLSHFGERV